MLLLVVIHKILYWVLCCFWYLKWYLLYSSNQLNLFLFGDDTNLLYADKNFRSLELTVNRELAIVCNWLMANKPSLNTKKSNFVIFRPYQKWMNFDITIKLFDHDKNFFILLERKDYAKYLEIIIDSNLPWKQHILFISLKTSKFFQD